MGLLERVTIFSFMVWMAVMSIVLSRDLRSSRRPRASHPDGRTPIRAFAAD